MIEPIKKELTQITGLKCFGVDNETLEEIVFKLLLKRKETIAVAESCTGGGIGSKLTRVPGSSRIFHGGVIAYNNLIKKVFNDAIKEFLASRNVEGKKIKEVLLKKLKQIKSSNTKIKKQNISNV